jgi:radical SAM superfamily enzyme YgiQ (UPF0313 family)
VYDFILGHPFETEADLQETLALCRQLAKPFRLQLHGLTFLPGTPIEKIAVEHGVKTWEEIKGEQVRPLREQYHGYAWWRKGCGNAQEKEKFYWYALIFLTQFPTGELIIRWACKRGYLKKHVGLLRLIFRLYNGRLTLRMGLQKLKYLMGLKMHKNTSKDS